VFLPVVKSQLRQEFQVAAQNCWVKKGGAFTGEIRLVFNSILADYDICHQSVEGLLSKL
jgi:triosephosphate isomerase